MTIIILDLCMMIYNPLTLRVRSYDFILAYYLSSRLKLRKVLDLGVCIPGTLMVEKTSPKIIKLKRLPTIRSECF